MKRGIRRVIKRGRRLLGVHRVAGAVIAVTMVGLIVGGGVYASLGGAPKNAASGDIELSKGLVGWWKLDGNAKDATPYANNGTVAGGAALTADREAKANSAYSFDGVDDEIGTVDRDYFSPTDNAMTISFWARVPTGASSVGSGNCGGTGAYMLAKGTGANSWEWGFENDQNSRMCLTLWPSDGSIAYAQITYIATINDNLWHNYTATIDYGTEVKLYRDGVQIGSDTSFTGSMTNGTRRVEIGRRGDGQFFAGDMDDVRIYNRLLNTAEITALYNTYGSGLAAASGEKDLVGWWKFDGSLKDATPYANNATAFSTAAYASDSGGISSKALSLNGLTDFVKVPDQSNLKYTGGNITLSAWIYPNVTESTDGHIFSKPWNSAGNYNYRLHRFNAGTIEVWVQGATSYDLYSDATVPTGAWSHVAMTIDSSKNVTIYINGVQHGSGTHSIVNWTPPNPDTNTELVIGSLFPYTTGWAGNTSYSFDGKIDDARIYTRALSAADIARLASSYNSVVKVSDLQKGLVGYWPLNGNAKDATPYGNNGTLAGAPSLTTDRKGRASSAYDFVRASSQYINLNSTPSITGGDLSLSIWAKTSTSQANNTIFSQNIPAPALASDAFVLYFGESAVSGGLRLHWNNGNAITNSTPVNDGSWHHIAVTRSGTSLLLYKDGVQIGSATAAANFTSTNTYIGAVNSNGSMVQAFTGSIDEPRIYNRALSAAEIKALYDLYN